MKKKELSNQVTKSSKQKKTVAIDLRIHTPGSYGYRPASVDETARAVVRLAVAKGVDAIAITDIASASFIDAVIGAAQSQPITVIPGTELNCMINGSNRISIIALFPEGGGSALVEDCLRSLSANSGGSYELAKVIREVEIRAGVTIPTRTDKTPQLKEMIPALVKEFGYRAFDLAYADSEPYFKKMWPKEKFTFFSFSNATSLSQVGSRMSIVKSAAAHAENLFPIMERANSGSSVRVAKDLQPQADSDLYK
jgi:hypothetical protein